MPVYEYRCEDCDEEFEAFRSISDESSQRCPSCSSETCKKLISLSSFKLNGEGWAKDLYAKKT